jgi:hypothetical protein
MPNVIAFQMKLLEYEKEKMVNYTPMQLNMKNFKNSLVRRPTVICVMFVSYVLKKRHKKINISNKKYPANLEPAEGFPSALGSKANPE